MARIHWFNTLFLLAFPVASIIGLYAYFSTETFNWWMLVLFIVFYFATGLSITAGYHRLFAHRSYEAHPIIEFFYLVFGAAAFENSALAWCSDHRVHHRHIDKEKDPYNIQKGFWYAHIGWIMLKSAPIDKSPYSRDLKQNKMLMWQDKYYLPIAIASGVALPTFLGYLAGSWLGGFVFGFILRVTLVHHFTFFINSLCHIWGRQTYSDADSSKDSPLMALFTYGEGYHNFHHTFHNDYRNGIRWYHFDPSKWLIRSLAWIRLTSGLKRTDKVKIMQAKLQMQRKKLQEMVPQTCELRVRFHSQIESLQESMMTAYEDLQTKKQSYKLAYKEFRERKSIEAQQKVLALKLELQNAKWLYRKYSLAWKQMATAV